MLVKCVLRAVAMILISEDVIPPGQEIVTSSSHNRKNEDSELMKTVGPKARQCDWRF